MKKIARSVLSCLLVLLLVFTNVCFATAKSVSEDGLSVCVASDIHYRPASALEPIGENDTVPGSELYHHANSKCMLSYEADAILDEFFSRVESSGAEFLLIPGDLSEDGFWEEHLAIAEKLREFQSRTGKTIFLIPGNHDIRTSASKSRLDLEDFLEIYADIGFDKALTRHEGSASYTAELNGGYRLLAIDACVYREDKSEISDGLYAWIEAQLKQAAANGKKTVAMVHHNVLKHFELESAGGTQLCLDRNDDVANLLADYGVKYVLTGHEHANDITTAVSSKGNRIFDIETGCLITYPNAYRIINFKDNAVEIKTDLIDKIDTSLLPDGFSAEQILSMDDDFPAYSHGYFRAGLKSFSYYIPNYTSKIAKTLKVKEGSKGYEAIERIMDVLGEALRMPLYDTQSTPEADSVSELAALARVTLPESEYTEVIDVAAVLYADHYKGDESSGYDSTEVKLLFAGLEAVLVSALTDMPAGTANALLRDILPEDKMIQVPEGVTVITAKRVYMRNAAKIIMREIIRPLARGIVDDYAAPADINVSLEPYGGSLPLEGDASPITPLEKFKYLISGMLNVFFNTVRAFLNSYKDRLMIYD